MTNDSGRNFNLDGRTSCFGLLSTEQALNTFQNLYKYILKSGQIYSAFGKIHLAIKTVFQFGWQNLLFRPPVNRTSPKYILKFRQIYLAVWTNIFCKWKNTLAIKTNIFCNLDGKTSSFRLLSTEQAPNIF